MNDLVTSLPLDKLSLWKGKTGRRLLSLVFELTARCNLNCRHCYINVPAADKDCSHRELSLAEYERIAGEAVSMGALWVLITGGEPLLRPDFFELFTMLKRKGLLVSLFTNATLITDEHVRFFQTYPPRNLEISIYGVSAGTYESVTRVPGSFKLFMQGFQRLVSGGIPVRLKAMALRSNIHEIVEIGRFCRRYTKDYYRFDPFLTLRYDGNPARNREIVTERLTSAEIVLQEAADPERFEALCRKRYPGSHGHAGETGCNHLFTCNAGNAGLVVGPAGECRLCYSSWDPGTVFDLRRGSLTEAFMQFVPRVQRLEFNDSREVRECQRCPIIDLCQWCPANAFLETRSMEAMVPFFCELAHARAEMLGIAGVKHQQRPGTDDQERSYTGS